MEFADSSQIPADFNGIIGVQPFKDDKPNTYRFVRRIKGIPDSMLTLEFDKPVFEPQNLISRVVPQMMFDGPLCRFRGNERFDFDKPFLVMGNGPSAQACFEPGVKLDNYIVIGMNHIYRMQDKNGHPYVPDIWVLSDDLMIEALGGWKALRFYNTIFIIKAQIWWGRDNRDPDLEKLILSGKNIHVVIDSTTELGKESAISNLIDFDFVRYIIGVPSSMFAAIQIALIIARTEVHVVGMGGKGHCYAPFSGEEAQRWNPSMAELLFYVAKSKGKKLYFDESGLEFLGYDK